MRSLERFIVFLECPKTKHQQGVIIGTNDGHFHGIKVYAISPVNLVSIHDVCSTFKYDSSISIVLLLHEFLKLSLYESQSIVIIGKLSITADVWSALDKLVDQLFSQSIHEVGSIVIDHKECFTPIGPAI